jgi:hypothetical protein
MRDFGFGTQNGIEHKMGLNEMNNIIIFSRLLYIRLLYNLNDLHAKVNS